MKKLYFPKFFKSNNVCETFIYINPFEDYFIEIESEFNVNVEYNFISLDLRLVFLSLIGLILYFEAERISRSLIFYYSSGIFLGILFSLLVLLVILLKLDKVFLKF